MPNVTVKSDHKPLEAVMRRTLGDVPAQIQRMLLRIQKYDVNVKYIPGKVIAHTYTESGTFASESR